MSPYNVLVADHLHESGWQVLKQAEDVAVHGPFKERSQVLSTLADMDALIVRSTTQVDRELLNQAPRLRVIARAGAQIQNIDIDAATEQGIAVINAPEAHITAVVEHTFAMLLSLARMIPQADHQVRQGDWHRHEILGFELQGKVLGILGFGRLGQEVAKRALAFNMKVLAYDPYKDLSFARAQGVEMVDINELLKRSDIISLHTAYTTQTHHMINAQTLARLKPGAFLVNCVHADLIDEAALVEALRSRHLGGAAVDTFHQEPPPAEHPLLGLANTVVAPHLNQNTLESQSLTSYQVVEDVLAALRMEDYRHVVNLPFYEGSLEHPAVLYRQVKPYINLAEKLGKLQGQLAEGWITRVEVEVLGEGASSQGARGLVRPVAAMLLAGMLRSVNGQTVNWISAPVLASKQSISMAQAKGLVDLADYPNLIACRVFWDEGHRTIAGVLFGNGEARLVQYDHFRVDAVPEGYVLVLENLDQPGVIGKVGTRLGREGINIAQWRYGREENGSRAVSFINLDSRVPKELLLDLEKEPEIQHARLVNL